MVVLLLLLLLLLLIDLFFSFSFSSVVLPHDSTEKESYWWKEENSVRAKTFQHCKWFLNLVFKETSVSANHPRPCKRAIKQAHGTVATTPSKLVSACASLSARTGAFNEYFDWLIKNSSQNNRCVCLMLRFQEKNEVLKQGQEEAQKRKTVIHAIASFLVAVI